MRLMSGTRCAAVVAGSVLRHVPPHFFQCVELPHLGAEKMNNDVAGVDDDPIPFILTLNPARPAPLTFSGGRAVLWPWTKPGARTGRWR